MMNKKKPNDVTGLLSDRDSEIHWVEFAGKFRAGGLDFKRERLPLPADGMVQHWLSVQHIPNLQGDVIKKPENVEGLGQEFTAHVYTRPSVCKVMGVSERVRGAFGGYHIGRNDSKTCDDDSSCEVFW